MTWYVEDDIQIAPGTPLLLSDLEYPFLSYTQSFGMLSCGLYLSCDTARSDGVVPLLNISVHTTPQANGPGTQPVCRFMMRSAGDGVSESSQIVDGHDVPASFSAPASSNALMTIRGEGAMALIPSAGLLFYYTLRLEVAGSEANWTLHQLSWAS